MATWYVNIATGTDDATAGRGTSATNPFKTLAFITSRTVAPYLAPGDVVYVAPGVYQGTVMHQLSGTLANPIKFIADNSGYYSGTNAGSVVFTGWVNAAVSSAYCVNLNGFDYLYYEGFTITMAATAGVLMAGSIYCEFNNCTFERTYKGISSGTSTSSGTTRLSVHDCTFNNCYMGIDIEYSASNLAAVTGGAPYWNSACQYYFVNNTFNGGYYGIYYYGYNGTTYYYIYNDLLMGNTFNGQTSYAIYSYYTSRSTNSSDTGWFRNIFKSSTNSYCTSITGVSVMLAGNVLTGNYFVTDAVHTILPNITPTAPSAGTNHVGLPIDAFAFNGDGAAYNPLANYSAYGLYLEKTAPIQGTASGKLYGYVQNKYKWRIPADLNQSLGVMLSAQRSWASGLGGSVTFRLYDEAGILTPTTATLQDDNFLHTVTVANITMPYKGFAILEVEIVPRTSGTALGDNCLIDDIQII